MIVELALAWAVIFVGGWLAWQLLCQNGRILLRLDVLEKRLNELEFGEGLKEATAAEREKAGGQKESKEKEAPTGEAEPA